MPAKSLSGGNLQRMVVAREMIGDPRLIIASYLTRGLDVQSAIAAHQALVQARDDPADGDGLILLEPKNPPPCLNFSRYLSPSRLNSEPLGNFPSI